MRSILVIIYAIIICIISLPLYLVALILKLINPMLCARFSQVFVRYVFIIAMFLSGSKKVIIGRDRVPTDTPVLYAANHRSFYDVLLSYSTVPTQTAYISKIEVSRYPCINIWMRFLRCIFIDRDDLKQQMQVIKKATEEIQEGYSIFISPEGTRNATDELLTFKEGSMRMATKTGYPVIPVCIMNTETQFENALPWIKGATIVIEYGEPIYTDKMSREELKHVGALAQEKVAAMYKKNLSFLEK